MSYINENVAKTSSNRTIELIKAKSRAILKTKEDKKIHPPQRAKAMSETTYDLVIEYFTMKTLEDPTKNPRTDLNQYKKRLSTIILDIVKDCGSIDAAEKMVDTSIEEYKNVFTGTSKDSWIGVLDHLKQTFRRRVLGQ